MKKPKSKVYKDLAKEGPPKDKKPKRSKKEEGSEDDFYLAEESAQMIGSN